MAPSSFGLQSKTDFLEEVYLLVRHCRVDYAAAWNMPVAIRHWWIDKVNKEIEEKNKVAGNVPGKK